MDDCRKSGNGDGGSGERTSDFIGTGHESSGRATQRGISGDRIRLRDDGGGQIGGGTSTRAAAAGDERRQHEDA